MLRQRPQGDKWSQRGRLAPTTLRRIVVSHAVGQRWLRGGKMQMCTKIRSWVPRAISPANP